VENWGGKRYPLLDQLDRKTLSDVTTESGRFREDMMAAAKLHAAVVRLRPYDDIHRFECIRKESELLMGAGQVDAALGYLVEAADYARNTGMVYEAARTYLDAAVLAQETSASDVIGQLALRARLLSYSPLLKRQQRKEIQHRLGKLPERIAALP